MADHGHEEAGEEHDHGQHRHGQHVMDCEEVLHRLYHFLDGEVAAADRGTIQQHLDACMACLEAFEFEAEFKVIVATKCKEQAPADLRARIVRAIFDEEPRRPGTSDL